MHIDICSPCSNYAPVGIIRPEQFPFYSAYRGKYSLLVLNHAGIDVLSEVSQRVGARSTTLTRPKCFHHRSEYKLLTRYANIQRSRFNIYNLAVILRTVFLLKRCGYVVTGWYRLKSIFYI